MPKEPQEVVAQKKALNKRSSPIFRRCLVACGALAAAYAVMCVWLYVRQDALLYHPDLAGKCEYMPAPAHHAIDAVEITQGSVVLRGWFLKSKTASPASTMLYFGGNAENVCDRIPFFDGFEDWSVVLMNYRGYGDSTGTPGERAFLRDALAAYDYAASRADVDAARMVAFGYSLGSGLAVDLASRKTIAGVVLVSPYDSMTNIARGAYPLFPVSVLLKDRFDSLARVGALRMPALFVAADHDTVIPLDHTQRLYAAYGGEKTLRVIAGTDHGSIIESEELWNAVHEFLR